MRRTTAAVALLLLLATVPAGAAPQGEKFLANAMAMGNVSGTSRIEFNIERWSTEEERARYLGILAESGQEALVDAFQEQEVGRARVGTRATYPISYAFQTMLSDGTRRVVLATDRPIGALEAVAGARTLAYAVSIVEMRFPPGEEHGEGAVVIAGEIIADAEHHTLSLENYGQAPVQLRNVRTVE